MNTYERSLIAHIRREVPLSDVQASRVLDAFYPRRLKKKEILLFEGEVSSHMRFITEGCLRAYYLDENAQEHTLQFGIEDWWVNDLYSYLTRTPAKLFIQAVQASAVLQVQRDALEELFAAVPVMERFFRLKIQAAYVANQERTHGHPY